MATFKYKENGVVKELILPASGIKLLDIENNFQSKNLEEVLKEIGETDNVYLGDIDPNKDGLWFDTSDQLDTNVNNDIVSRLKTYFNGITGSLSSLLTNYKTDLVGAINENYGSISQLSNPNLLINGDFQVWQRGTSFNVANGVNTYTADRWLTATGGTYTISNISTGGLRIANSTDFTSNSRFQQHIEVPKSLQGKTVTLSFKVKSSVNKNIGVALCPYGEAIIASKTITTTSTSQIYSITLTLPTGKDIITIVFALATNTTSYFGLTAVTNFPVCNIDFEWVKLEQGTIVTPFVPRSYVDELRLCQRYYEKSYYDLDYAGTHTRNGSIFAGQFLSGVLFRYPFTFKVNKRIPPTMSIYSTENGTLNNVTQWNTSGAVGDLSATATDVSTGGVGRVEGSFSSGCTFLSFQWIADAEIY